METGGRARDAFARCLLAAPCHGDWLGSVRLPVRSAPMDKGRTVRIASRSGSGGGPAGDRLALAAAQPLPPQLGWPLTCLAVERGNTGAACTMACSNARRPYRGGVLLAARVQPGLPAGEWLVLPVVPMAQVTRCGTRRAADCSCGGGAVSRDRAERQTAFSHVLLGHRAMTWLPGCHVDRCRATFSPATGAGNPVRRLALCP